MPKTCDNKSVGIIVWKDGKLLMIERKKYPFGFALPAGHQDGDLPEKTAAKELSEEVGLIAEKLEKKLEISFKNPCRREGGTHHAWTIFEAILWYGELKPSDEETKKVFWADNQAISSQVAKFEEFMGKVGMAIDSEKLPEITKLFSENELWKESPGLEPVMYFIFKDLGII